MKGNIEEELNTKGYYLNTTVGSSMWPMLRSQKDQVKIVPISSRKKPLQRCDLPLYRRPSGQYVLHRILRVQKKAYIVCGDNRWKTETIPKEWVIGVTESFFRGSDSEIPVTDLKYRIYTHVWCDLGFIRRTILWLIMLPVRLWRKFKSLSVS